MSTFLSYAIYKYQNQLVLRKKAHDDKKKQNKTLFPITILLSQKWYATTTKR